jgi:hypothetical protein
MDATGRSERARLIRGFGRILFSRIYEVDVISSIEAAGALFFTDAIPPSISAGAEYIWLFPIT